MPVQKDIDQLRDLVTEAIAIYGKDEDVPTKPGKGKVVDLAEFNKRQEADIKAQRDFMSNKVPQIVGLFFSIFGSAFVNIERIADLQQQIVYPKTPEPS
jgi:hypothetical protein